MTTSDAVLLAFGGNVALLAAVAWLARSLLQNWLTKDVERFKATLLNESGAATEKLRHGLSLVAVEHQVSFSKLHDRRAEVIAEAYGKLVEAYWSMENFVSPIEWSGEPTKLEKYQDAMTKARDYFRYFDKNRIFLPAELCSQLDEFLQGMRSKVVGFGVWLQMENQHPPEVTGSKKFAAWLEAGKYFEEEAPRARKLLEDELRKILNPECAS